MRTIMEASVLLCLRLDEIYIDLTTRLYSGPPPELHVRVLFFFLWRVFSFESSPHFVGFAACV